MGNGALAIGPSYRAHPRLYLFPGLATGRARQLCPGISDLDFLRDLKGVVDLGTQVAHDALDLGVAEQ